MIYLVGFLFLFFVLFPGHAPAQSVGYRTHFIFHVWVDPLNGDDTLALSSNPVGGSNPGASNLALSKHPVIDPNTGNPYIDGRIQHAPFAFQTVTKALEYVRTQFFLQGNQIPYRLPWKNPKPGDNAYWITAIVIHCLPGIYAPRNYVGEIDPYSGLPYNGETFPLGLHNDPSNPWQGIPPGVSIQGTSALDTIFDGRGRDGFYNHVFLFENTASCDDVTHLDSFIDSITVRDVRSKTPPQDKWNTAVYAPDGAGIVIRGEARMRPTISNCIITDCYVGIAIGSDQDYDPNNLLFPSPIIVNNTIVWNQIGIYSGPLKKYNAPSQNWMGLARPRCFNNIIDRRLPDGSLFQGPGGVVYPSSCFEGLDASDLLIMKIGSTNLNPYIHFNAYDYPGGGNLGHDNYPPGWRGLRTKKRSAVPYGPPRYNMSGFTSSGKQGVLFITDTFRQKEGVSNNKDSRSPHDFRLTPMASLNGGNSFFLNPVVNIGVDTSAGTLRFVNYDPKLAPDVYDPGNGNPETPGLPSPGAQTNGFYADLASFHAFDWDGEGFGNPRVEIRSDFPGPPSHSTYIDLGADEMGQLIVSGFIDGTRILSRDVPGRTKGWAKPPSPSGDNTQVYFLDKYYAGNTYQRPKYNDWIGRGFYYGYNGLGGMATYFEGRWWEFVQANPIVPNPYGGNNARRFTEGMDQLNPSPPPTYMYSLRRSYVKSGLPGFMRSLECDFSPFLVPDFHPCWGSFSPPWNQNLVFNDVFSSNPWYHTNSLTCLNSDNRYLYYGANSWIILEGTINPPGATTLDPTLGYLLGGPFGQFGPYGYTGSNFYSVDSWGVGDVSPGPDIVPDTEDWKGVRFNLQQYYPGNTFSNLQTFLGVNGPITTVPPINAAYKYPPKMKFSGPPSQKTIDKEVLRLWEKIQRGIGK